MPNSRLKVGIIVKLEPDLSSGSVTYNPDGTLNRTETVNILGPHSAIACEAGLYSKVKHNAALFVASMGPPMAEVALQQAAEICCADELHLYSDRSFAGADTLATAYTLALGLSKLGGLDLVISGHRAVDGETGQTGPQTAAKLGFEFIGNVTEYDLDPEARILRAKRVVKLPGLYDVEEYVECPLPAFISIDPSYRPRYTKVSERLRYEFLKRESRRRALNYKALLKVWNAEALGVDRKKCGLQGSPTIVYKVARIPKARASRNCEVVDGGDPEGLEEVAKRLVELLRGE